MTTTAPIKQDAWKHTFIDPCENENFNFQSARYREQYLGARRYEISLRAFNSIAHEWEVSLKRSKIKWVEILQKQESSVSVILYIII